MIDAAHPKELERHVGAALAHSDWREIEAEDIFAFGRLTDDEHWAHMDRARAKRDSPFGDIIAHGFFTLSLVTGLSRQCLRVASAARFINYGIDRLRFISPVRPGDKVRLGMRLTHTEVLKDGGVRATFACTVERQGQERPALAAEWIIIVYE